MRCDENIDVVLSLAPADTPPQLARQQGNRRQSGCPCRSHDSHQGQENRAMRILLVRDQRQTVAASADVVDDTYFFRCEDSHSDMRILLVRNQLQTVLR